MTDAIKNSLSASLQPFAKGKVADGLQSLGQRYPCTVAEVISSGIVLVNFEVNAAPFTLPKKKVPVVGSEYVRLPIQVGDKGMCVSADARLGGMTGLGSGTPGLTRPGNLSALAFIWLGNTDWSPTIDPNALQLMANVLVKETELSFFANPTVVQQEITGALSSVADADAKAVLTSIIAALVNYGLVTDGTT